MLTMNINAKKIKVFIVSQQALFRRGIELAVSSVADIEISGDADYNDGVAYTIDDVIPDVAILDTDISTDEGFMLAHRIKQRLPSIGIIIVAHDFSDKQIFQALKAQAAAFLNKEITPEQLIDMIRRVARGEYPINENLTTRPNVADQVLKKFQELSWESEIVISSLTPREKEILNYIAQGYLNKQIAAELDISEQTIKNHVTSILRKLNANARTEAVVLALKQGILTLD
jgi:two-component system response regulator DegU